MFRAVCRMPCAVVVLLPAWVSSESRRPAAAARDWFGYLGLNGSAWRKAK
jgi:hypothetical protein